MLSIKDVYNDYHEGSKKLINSKIEICGWIKNSRFQKKLGFIELNDGTYFKTLQIVVEENIPNMSEVEKLHLSSAIKVTGTLVETESLKQPFEIKAEKIEILGESTEDYPLQKKRHTFEYLRTIQHLRPRTNTFYAIFKVRSVLSYAIHKFFNDRGFVYVHTPIITSSDAEGAGEMFRVTTLDLDKLPKDENSKVDYKQDFFGKQAHLTVSGQLEAEAMAMAFNKVYTFGPTFRAENSNTTRHAAEFWMIEPEIAFADLKDVMNLAEDMVKFIINYVLENAKEEMEFFNKFVDNTLIERLTKIVKSNFKRITYTEAINILLESKREFDNKVSWGIDLYTEHERYLSEEVVNGPVFITDYPKEIKAFYMRLNDDGKTVAAMDLLVPGIGELIGGSQREERYDILKEKMKNSKMDISEYNWYLDLRKYGGVNHGGYGLGFERMLMYLTGMSNIRDVLLFPRTVGLCEY